MGTAGGLAVGVAGTYALTHETIPTGRPVPPAGTQPAPAGGEILNDASLLNPTPVARHIMLDGDPGEALIARLRTAIADARAKGQPFCASAARHSMGGQSLARDGTAVTLHQQFLEADTGAGIYRVAAGMRWGDVIAALDRIGQSPKVMQSNNDFGVASTYCVNAHGWPVSHPPFGATVRSLRMITADGSLIECSRTQNREMFAHAMGGYGLTGAIVDLDVEMVPNRRLDASFERMAGRDFGMRFVERLEADPAIEMAYGRLDVTIGSFFEEAMLITYRPAADQADLPPASGSGFVSRMARHIFRAQLDSDRVKAGRWLMETRLGPMITGSATRNSLVNEPVVTLDDRDPGRTDILHEYFVAPERFAEFVNACQDVIPSSYQQLLNITLRYVKPDNESVLSYATTPRICCVMLFSQEMSSRGEADMERMTRALIARTLETGGAYYLPYRLHATDGQFRRCYPRAGEFAAFKRAVDPDPVFRNALWDRYMAGL